MDVVRVDVVQRALSYHLHLALDVLSVHSS